MIKKIVWVSTFFLFLSGCVGEERENSGKQATGVESPSGQASGGQNVLLGKKRSFNVQKYEVQATAVKSIGFDGSNVWLGTTSRGTLNFDTTTKTSITLYDYENALISNGVFDVLKGPGGNMWIGTYGGGLSRFDGSKWSNFNIQHGLCDSFVYETLFDQKNVMWIATWSGVNKVTGNIEDPKSWERFTKKNTDGGLSDDWVYSMELADDGSLWFGTEFGLSFYDGKSWKNWTNKEGLGGSPEVLKEENKDYAENVFQGSHHANQANYTGMQNLSIATFNPNHVTGMKLDNKTGILWIGTWGGGLSKFDGKKFVSYTKKDGLASNYVLSVDQGRDGSIWLGTDEGVNRLKDGKFDLYTTKDGLLTDFTFVVKIDDKGRLWAGGPGGVSLVRNI